LRYRGAGFVPNRLLASTIKPEAGMKIKAMFIEVDEGQEKLVLSQKRILEADVLRKLEVGQVVRVRNVVHNVVHNVVTYCSSLTRY
jgi:ribosomal protein S1